MSGRSGRGRVFQYGPPLTSADDALRCYIVWRDTDRLGMVGRSGMNGRWFTSLPSLDSSFRTREDAAHALAEAHR